jgi:hypothetical protein
MNEANCEFPNNTDVKDVMASGNEVTKGLYRDRYGKWERRMGESGGGGESSDVIDVDELRRDDSDEKNDR